MNKETRENLAGLIGIVWFFASLHGLLLGFNAGTLTGLYMLATVFTPCVSAVAYWVTLGNVDLAQYGYSLYTTNVGTATQATYLALAGVAAASYLAMFVLIKVTVAIANPAPSTR